MPQYVGWLIRNQERSQNNQLIINFMAPFKNLISKFGHLSFVETFARSNVTSTKLQMNNKHKSLCSLCCRMLCLDQLIQEWFFGKFLDKGSDTIFSWGEPLKVKGDSNAPIESETLILTLNHKQWEEATTIVKVSLLSALYKSIARFFDCTVCT